MLITVINALSDKYHPLQTLADLMALREHFGSLKGKTLAWVGDGNNVLHDLMIGALKQGMSVHVATPKNYDPDAEIVATAKALAKVGFAHNISSFTRQTSFADNHRSSGHGCSSPRTLLRPRPMPTSS